MHMCMSHLQEVPVERKEQLPKLFSTPHLAEEHYVSSLRVTREVPESCLSCCLHRALQVVVV